MGKEDMIQGLPHSYYYDFECTIKSLSDTKMDMEAVLDSGREITIDLWVGEAVNYKNPNSLKNLIGKRIKVTDAWLHAGTVWLTGTKIKVLK